ncbi:MAG TPA: hypothetical protein VK586_14095, partial [Streptosporangiaceae bacterium]|nr:hypothetical protein [Streptosporangiaceae bacterium]
MLRFTLRRPGDPVASACFRALPGRDVQGCIHVGVAHPYAVYDRIRARGTLVPTRVGDWATPSHRVCSAVLRDRRFGVRLDDEPLAADELDMSLLTMNPPDHTRLRRLIQPAFSPKIVAGYAGRIERTVTGLLDAAGEEFDLISDFAAVLPIAVITDLLG